MLCHFCLICFILKAFCWLSLWFQLAADAGNVIPMTEAEKKRLEELLSDETDLLMVEVCM